MKLESAIKHCEEVAEQNEKESKLWEGGVTEAFKQKEQKLCECASEHRQLAEWLKELKAYREAMIYLFTAEPDGYQLHKWTSEYGYVITVHDVIKAFNRVKEVQND